MSFEQLDKQRQEDENQKKLRESEKTLAFQLEKKILRESSDLLQRLASEISREFGIDISRVKELISENTSSWLESLKSHLTWNESPIDIDALMWAINGAKVQIEKMSKSHRESLKKSVEREVFSPETYDYKLSEKFISKATRLRAQNPSTIFDQSLWLGLGLIDSSEAVITFTYFLWKWILLTPYHLFLMVSWKAAYRWFSKI